MISKDDPFLFNLLEGNEEYCRHVYNQYLDLNKEHVTFLEFIDVILFDTEITDEIQTAINYMSNRI